MSEYRVLHVESPASIGLDTGRLCIRVHGKEPWFGCVEDIAALSLAHPAIRISIQALQALAAQGAIVMVADGRHLPTAVLYPMQAHALVAMRIRIQIRWLEDRPEDATHVWAQVVASKLRMQADTLRRLGRDGAVRLTRMAKEVSIANAQRMEALGARHYWKHLFGADFRREKRGAPDPRNAMLNYGYAVLRALVARQLALAGLHPSLGIHHRGPANPFNLADDLMEPLRPIVDEIVAFRLREQVSLDKQAKQALLGVVERTLCLSDGKEYRMHAALERMVQGLVRVMEGKGRLRSLPLPVAQGDETE